MARARAENEKSIAFKLKGGLGSAEEMMRIVDDMSEDAFRRQVTALHQVYMDRKRLIAMNKKKPLASRVREAHEKVTKSLEAARSACYVGNAGNAGSAALGLIGGGVALAVCPITGVVLGVTSAVGGLGFSAYSGNTISSEKQSAETQHGDIKSMMDHVLEAGKNHQLLADYWKVPDNDSQALASLERLVLVYSATAEQMAELRIPKERRPQEIYLVMYRLHGMVEGERFPCCATPPEAQLALLDQTTSSAPGFGSNAEHTVKISGAVGKAWTQHIIRTATAAKETAVTTLEVAKVQKDFAKFMVHEGKDIAKQADKLVQAGKAGQVAKEGKALKTFIKDARAVRQGATAAKEEGRALLQEARLAKQGGKVAKSQAQSSISWMQGLTVLGMVVDGVFMAYYLNEMSKGSPFEEQERMSQIVQELGKKIPIAEAVQSLVEEFDGDLQEEQFLQKLNLVYT